MFCLSVLIRKLFTSTFFFLFLFFSLQLPCPFACLLFLSLLPPSCFLFPCSNFSSFLLNLIFSLFFLIIFICTLRFLLRCFPPTSFSSQLHILTLYFYCLSFLSSALLSFISSLLTYFKRFHLILLTLLHLYFIFFPLSCFCFAFSVSAPIFSFFIAPSSHILPFA